MWLQSSYIRGFPQQRFIAVILIIFLFGLLFWPFGCVHQSSLPPEPALPEDLISQAYVRVAILPVHNRSSAPAPLDKINQLLNDLVQGPGIIPVEASALEAFMARNRLRYLGGINPYTAERIKEEAGAEAVLITSLDLYNDHSPSKIALTSRLVSVIGWPRIIWTNKVAMAASDTRGLFNLSLVNNPDDLKRQALKALFEPLSFSQLSTEARVKRLRKQIRFGPKTRYFSPLQSPKEQYTIAVLPFYNNCERKYAGDIIGDLFVKELADIPEFEVIEPGVIRELMLSLRIIMEDGLSLSNAGMIFGKLDADLIISGRVLDFQDYQSAFGRPLVDFSVLVIERQSQQVIWTSKSYNHGEEGVFFFDYGKIRTAHTLASAMVLQIVDSIAKRILP